MNYQIIIPARGGSKRFPGKNIAFLDNKPLIQHTLDYALINGYQNRIWVNTDDNKIVDFSKKEGVNISIRPDELGGDFVPTIDVLKHQLAFFRENNIPCDAFILLQATNPLRPINLLKDAVLKFESCKRESLATFSSLKKKFGSIKEDFFKPENYIPGQRSQDLEKFFFENGLLYIVTVESILKGKIITDDVYPMLVDDIEANIDIDEPTDMILAEFIIKNIKNGK
jgi:N-acylneuraminate cytidylyltransferase